MRLTFYLLLFVFSSCISKSKTQEKDVQSIISTKGKVDSDSVENTRCEYDQLSDKFNFHVDFKRYLSTSLMFDSCYLQVKIVNKNSNDLVDSLHVFSDYYFDEVMQNCLTAVSYTNSFNLDFNIQDNYFGDIIVCDLNFDGLEDLAVIRNSGGNGGSEYNFYIQSESNKFYRNDFLSDTMRFFPSKINKKNQTITTLSHAGACCLSKRVFQSKNNSTGWEMKSSALKKR